MGTWGAGVFQSDEAHERASDAAESADPVGLLSERFTKFLAGTVAGYDSSEWATESLCQAQGILALCEVVRAGAIPTEDWPEPLPLNVPKWFESTKFRSSEDLLRLATACAQVLRDSERLREEDADFWTQSVEPTLKGLIDVAEKLLAAELTS